MFVYKVVLENTQKKISRAKNSKLFVNIFHARCKNTIASILRENVLVYLFLDVICSLSSIHFVPWIFAPARFWERTWILMKNVFLFINSKSKTRKQTNSHFQFPISFSDSPFPILHIPSLLLATSAPEFLSSPPLAWKLLPSGESGCLLLSKENRLL